MNWLEAASFALSLICVLCNIRQNPWGWGFAIAGSGLYAIVFFESRLYGDAGLQIFFIGAAFFGLWQWLYGRMRLQPAAEVMPSVQEADARLAPLRPHRMSPRELTVAGMVWAAGYVVLAWFLSRHTNSDVPHIDAFLTAGSIVGQFALARKFIENWWIWLVVDVFYVGLYLHKSLYLTAVLYAIFVVLCVAGLRTWRQALRTA
jgi:nicotinamide mononucleotide transporter